MDFPKVKPCLDTSEDNLIEELYLPCFKWAKKFDRGVGFFTTGWISYNIEGMSDFASRGGKMRLITSPILSNDDRNAFQNFKRCSKIFFGYHESGWFTWGGQ